MIDSFVITEQAEIEHQRAEMERAYISTVVEQQEQQDLLRNTIRELSTPIIPVYEGILVLPLVGSIDSRRAAEITERLLEAIAAQQAEIVIIDITGVSLIDTSTANHLLMTTRAANLLGSRVVLVGHGFRDSPNDRPPWGRTARPDHSGGFTGRHRLCARAARPRHSAASTAGAQYY